MFLSLLERQNIVKMVRTNIYIQSFTNFKSAI